MRQALKYALRGVRIGADRVNYFFFEGCGMSTCPHGIHYIYYIIYIVLANATHASPSYIHFPSIEIKNTSRKACRDVKQQKYKTTLTL